MMHPIDRLLAYVQKESIRLDGLLVCHDEAICASVFWRPYTAHSIHRMYSITKSLTSLCIGICVDQGILSLDDTLGELFRSEIEGLTSDSNILTCTVENLLQMESPHTQTTYKLDLASSWFESFFRVSSDKKPGTQFDYDTSATYILGLLVEKVSGFDFEIFLKRYIMDPLGFEDPWSLQRNSEGKVLAGSGLSCSAWDLIKLAKIFEGEIVSETYLEGLRTPSKGSESPRMPSRLHERYGYQVWLQSEAVIFWGMAGQLLITVPDKKLTIALIANCLHQKAQEMRLYDFISDLMADPDLLIPYPKTDLHHEVYPYSSLDFRCQNQTVVVSVTETLLCLDLGHCIYDFILGGEQCLGTSQHRIEVVGGWKSMHQFEMLVWFIGEEQGHFWLEINQVGTEWWLESKLYLEFGFRELAITKQTVTMIQKD